MNGRVFDIGMVGLGVMGRNLAMNIADHGYQVAGFDTDEAKRHALAAGGPQMGAVDSLASLVQSLRRPRAVLLLVPAGKPVDAVLGEIAPLLAADDIIIDGGNSHFTDTDRRALGLAERGIRFLGTGVSGGERGAREGPSIMPGGPPEAYWRVAPFFEAVAARVEGRPCVAYLGAGSAGHYTKMVHNGIEYALMELIAEAYDLMKRGLGLDNEAIASVFAEWNRRILASFLLEITSVVLTEPDDRAHGKLVDKILDVAEQKGTGRWASQDAMELQVPIPTIDAAVAAREISHRKKERAAASALLTKPEQMPQWNREEFLSRLENALVFSWFVTFAQGFSLLQAASEARAYGVPLAEVARIWRGGCIIRARVLEGIGRALEQPKPARNLLLDPDLSREVLGRQADTRALIAAAAAAGIPVPCFMASLAYFDAYRSERLPANLIQGQRDLFGAHTYERVDAGGAFHHEWK